MKKRLKTMNRGIFLGLVCIAILVIYIIYDKTTFSSEVPKISATLQDYVSDIEKLSINNRTITKENEKACSDEACTVIDKYWCDKAISSADLASSLTKADLRQSVKDTFSYENTKGEPYMKSLKLDILDSIVSKAGPNLAKVSVTYKLESLSTGTCPFLNISEISYSFDYNSDSEDGTLKKGVLLQYTSTATSDIIFSKENGEWKIANVTSSNFSNENNQYVTEGGEDGNSN